MQRQLGMAPDRSFKIGERKICLVSLKHQGRPKKETHRNPRSVPWTRLVRRQHGRPVTPMVVRVTPVESMPDDKKNGSHQPWYVRCADRFQREKSELEAIGFQLDEAEVARSSTIRFLGQARTRDSQKLCVIYHDGFPSLAPSVLGDGNGPLLGRHQDPHSRAYCLFGPEGREWDPKNTGVTAVERAESLINGFPSGGPRLSLNDDPLPEPRSVDFRPDGTKAFLVPPEIAALLPKDRDSASSGKFQFAFEGVSGAMLTCRAVVLSASFLGQQVLAGKAHSRMVGGKAESGVLVFLPSAPPHFFQKTQLRGILSKAGIANLPDSRWYALIFPEESQNRQTIRYSWVIFEREKQDLLRPVLTSIFRPEERSARIPNLAWLREKKVALVGCGALGSKIAANLAASGVERFLLVDHDRMEPQNAIRHEGGVEEFGLPKTEVVVRRIIRLNPEAFGKVHSLPMMIGAHSFAEGRRFLDDLKGVDILVMAAGNGCLSRFLNEICYDRGICSVHATITNGAWSGEVVRAVPQRTPCWLCWDAKYWEHRPIEEPAPSFGIYGPGCSQPTFTGTTHEVGMIANLATTMVIDTLRLAHGQPSELPGDYLRWHGRDANGKPLFQTEFLQIPWRGDQGDNACSLCTVGE